MTLRATQDTTALVPSGASFRRVKVKADQFVPEHWVGDTAGGPVPGVRELTDVELAVIRTPPASAKWQIDVTGQSWAGEPEELAVIESITPASASIDGGALTLTVVGTGFTADMQLMIPIPGGGELAFSAASATDTEWVSAEQDPGNAGLQMAAVGDTVAYFTGPPRWQPSSNEFPFEWTAPLPPQVSSVAPASGASAGGEWVTVNGVYLGTVSGATFGGAPAAELMPSGTTFFQALTPAGVDGAVDVVVTTGGGQVTLAGGFTYATAGADEARAQPQGRRRAPDE